MILFLPKYVRAKLQIIHHAITAIIFERECENPNKKKR